jgi:hypothetical protein
VGDDRQLSRWFTAALVCGAFGGALRARGQDVVHAMPYTTLGGTRGMHHIVERGELRAYFGFDTARREVEVLWRFGPRDMWLFAGFGVETQRWRLAYWPTDICPLTDGRWLVSGKDSVTGETLIERWDFANGGWASATRLGEPDAVTGRAECRWELPERLRVTELYREATPGRDVVDLCAANPALPDHVFVRFQDSRDFYDLDVVTQRYTLVASPANSAAPLCAPRTGNGYDCFWSARHATHGFVFVVDDGSDLCGNTLRFRSRTVLCDSDEDGVLDRAFKIPASAWNGSDWTDGACYLEYFR